MWGGGGYPDLSPTTKKKHFFMLVFPYLKDRKVLYPLDVRDQEALTSYQSTDLSNSINMRRKEKWNDFLLIYNHKLIFLLIKGSDGKTKRSNEDVNV